MANITQTPIAWVLLIAIGVVTWIVYLTAWSIGPYQALLAGLALVNLAIAIWVLKLGRFKLRTWLLVGLGFLVSQWWLLQAAIVQAIWHIRGFAP